jgi:hypothetical protein
VLSQAGLLSKWDGKPLKKDKGFVRPLAAHQHWHIDVSYEPERLRNAGFAHATLEEFDGPAGLEKWNIVCEEDPKERARLIVIVIVPVALVIVGRPTACQVG